MITYEINRKSHLLEQLLNNAIIDSMKWIRYRCVSQEPDYVAALTLNFTSSLFNILRATFSLFEFSVTGVYCHQRPIVNINAKKNPELGDLLFVYIDKSTNEIRYNSLLLQAKISCKPELRIPLEERHQFELYSKWPEFEYLRAGCLNGQRRNIIPKTINDGAQYLLIDNNPITNGIYGFSNTYPMGCAVPTETLYINSSLELEIIDFLKFKSGRPFLDAHNTSNDDWSKMIWDLIHISATKFTRRKNAGLDGFPRVTECVYFSPYNTMKRAPLLEIYEDMPSYYDNARNITDEDVGVSLILIQSDGQHEQG